MNTRTTVIDQPPFLSRSPRICTIALLSWFLFLPTLKASDRPGVGPEAFEALRLAIQDLEATFGTEYAGEAYLKRLSAIETAWADRTKRKAPTLLEAWQQLKREALLTNPLLDFSHLLFVQRDKNAKRLGLPANWQGNCSLPRPKHSDQIMRMSMRELERTPSLVYRPDTTTFISDVDLHFEGQRMLFSAIGSNNRWQIFEIGVDGEGLRQVNRGYARDVDNYDACYLPDGNIVFTSTAGFKGVPCVKGSDHVANLYHMDGQGSGIRQLSFDQDHDWCPTVMGSGRVMYLRWEYSDLPHAFSRIMFSMNPDGTAQTALYGSNSYWPNSMFFARPIPGQDSKFVAVISGHHDTSRMGELILFDVAKGRSEADGVVQRIPGRGKPVEPILRDGLVKGSWPKFLHPWPLSDKYFIVAAKPEPSSAWGIYLVDTFDNMLLLKESPTHALLEPVPLRQTTKPPMIPAKTIPGKKDASVYIADIYTGPGLKNVARGTVKKLRLFTYHYAYHGMGGQINRVGLDGPWDIKRVLGTVPVETDGSAFFEIPANMPISIQPLDSEGKAVQLMRSWLVGLPGERVSCVGCHDNGATPSPRVTIAPSKPPATITPFYGPTRGFSFKREVQPVLDRSCVGCHDGEGNDSSALIDLTARPAVHPEGKNGTYNNGTSFSPSYLALRRFVRSPTIESDMHLLEPYEFHADTTRLVQLLKKGHHNVELDREAWDRIITWIDLHTPAHGTWQEIVGNQKTAHQQGRRLDMAKRYANRSDDPEFIPAASGKVDFVPPRPQASVPVRAIAYQPLDSNQAKLRQREAAELAQSDSYQNSPVAAELARYLAAKADLSAQPEPAPTTWSVPTVKAAVSKNGTTFKRQADGSLLAVGKAPDRDVYTITLETKRRGITAIRLEALPHSSLSRSGPGRAGNGNFVLSHIEVHAAPMGGGKTVAVPLHDARASHQQNSGGLSIAASLDADHDNSGWAVDFGGIGKAQAAVFHTRRPLGFAGGTRLSLTLHFGHTNPRHCLGHLRLSLTDAEQPVVIATASVGQKPVPLPDVPVRTVDLGQGVKMRMVLIPKGRFVMGQVGGHPDEQPANSVSISESFWMAQFELTNRQYAVFSPEHDSRLEHGDFLQFSQRERGYTLNDPEQPVVHVTWEQAMAFCAWLSKKTGETFTLPTEAQWEYACRAGTVTAMAYGDTDKDFAGYANLAAATFQSVDTLGWSLPSGAIPPWRPAIGSVVDGQRVSAPGGLYAANAWGLFDMHGNVAEWTRSVFKPYPYRHDGRNSIDAGGDRVVRGGSWYDRPQTARAAYRLGYRRFQGVYDVGFRLVCMPR